MEKKYQALITQSFTEGQAIADIVKGNFYQADRENEYFISEFNETVYLPLEKFDEYFREVKIKPYQQKAKKSYVHKQFRILLTFFPEDADIVEWLDTKKETASTKKETKGGRGGRCEYIRQLIRQDMAKNKGE